MSGVFVTDGTGPLGKALVSYYESEGCKVATHPSNGDSKSIREAIIKAGPIELLINNSEPEFERLSFEQINEKEFAAMVSSVVRTAFFAVQAVQPVMRILGGGKIINISSSAPVRGMLKGAHYTAAKGALYSLTRSWAQELAPDNIRVNLVAADVGLGTAAEDGGGKTPFDRPVSLHDIIRCVSFLAGSGGNMISGQEIIVDGGFTKFGF